MSVTSLWADERIYYPVDFKPYTPAHHFEGGKRDRALRTKLKIASELVELAIRRSVPFRAVVAAEAGEGSARRFRDGHEEAWWALEVDVGPYGPRRGWRAVVATTDPKELPDKATWYLTTNLPHPGSERCREEGALAAADLSEVVRLYGLRMWVEQSYKQVKHALGWSDYQVRNDLAIRRH